MSTRCNIKLVDGTDELWFYRHSDGYPKGAMPTLEEFMVNVINGNIRDNLSQAGGWLIYYGAKEYGLHDPNGQDEYSGWKVGSIEPTTGQHGDIEYLYTLDLVKKTIKTKKI